MVEVGGARASLVVDDLENVSTQESLTSPSVNRAAGLSMADYILISFCENTKENRSELLRVTCFLSQSNAFGYCGDIHVPPAILRQRCHHWLKKILQRSQESVCAARIFKQEQPVATSVGNEKMCLESPLPSIRLQHPGRLS